MQPPAEQQPTPPTVAAPARQHLNKKEVETWHARLKAARQDREPHLKSWNDTLRRIKGRHYRHEGGGDAPTSGDTVNLHNQYVRLMLPRLLPKDRVLACEIQPKKPGDPYAQSAETLRDRVNAVLSQTRAVTQVRRAARSAFYAAGVLKCTFAARTGIVAEVTSEKDKSQTVTVDVDHERTGNEFLDADLPTIQWRPASRFLVDPGATCIDDARWVADELYLLVEYLRTDPRFVGWADEHNIDLKQLKGTHSSLPRGMEESERDNAGNERDDPTMSYVRVYEVYDRAARTVRYIPDPRCGIQRELLQQDWLPIEGFPFAMVAYEEVEDNFWPNPPLGVTSDIKVGINAAVTKVFESIGEFKRFIGYDPENVTAEELTAVANAKNGEVVPIKGLSQHTQQFDLGGYPQGMEQALQTLMQFNDQLDGIDEINRGVVKQERVTATEINAAQMQGAIRMEDMRLAIDEAVRRMVEIVAAILVTYKDLFTEVYLPLADAEETKFIGFDDPDSMIGEALDYAYEMKTYQSERVDPAILLRRFQDAIPILQDPGLVMKIQQEGYDLKVGPALRDYLRTIGFKHPDAMLARMQDPAQQQRALAMQEDQQMLADGQPLPINPDDDHATHLEVHLQDFEQTQNESIAEHAMMHEAALSGAMMNQQGGGGPGGAATPVMPGPPPTPAAAPSAGGPPVPPTPPGAGGGSYGSERGAVTRGAGA